jgi:hypothetical protein
MEQLLIRFGQFLLRFFDGIWTFIKRVVVGAADRYETSWLFILAALAVLAALYALRPRGGGK